MATKKAAAKAPQASQREKKGAQTATKPTARPAKRSTKKGSARQSPSSATKAADTGKGQKSATKKTGRTAKAAKAAAPSAPAHSPIEKPSPLPPGRVGDKAAHAHQDPRLVADKAGPGLQGHRDPAKENHGMWKQRRVGHLDTVRNWFRRGRGR